MKKKLFITLILSLILTSCWTNKQGNVSDNSSNSWTVSDSVKAVQPNNFNNNNIENKKVSSIKLHINELPYEERQIFKDLESAIESKDKNKENELLKKINEDKITKEKTLKRAEITWDVDEITKIKKTLNVYDLVLN